MALLDSGSILVLSSFGTPLYSARGLTQTLTPIDGFFDVRRDINGNLVDIADQRFRKYKTTITCQDQQPPSIDQLKIGTIVTVDCVSELSYVAASGSPQKTPVAGSVRTVGDYVFYRPRINMMVTSFTVDTDEWAADISWTLELEEV
jgi:hypothetical protein